MLKLTYQLKYCIIYFLFVYLIQINNANLQRISAVFSTSKRSNNLSNQPLIFNGNQATKKAILKNIENNDKNIFANNLNTPNQPIHLNNEKIFLKNFVSNNKNKIYIKNESGILVTNAENITFVNFSLNNDIKNCYLIKPCKPGVILPVWKPQNVSFNTQIFRSIVYLLAMLYLFFGVSIVADRFMAAIEVITSQEKEIVIKCITGEKKTILVNVWNETVKNLTLMALGSSTPEILLSIIEICGNNFEAGNLGPSTIVGSAAFNLFVIIAICIYTVPSNEIRRIQRVDIFWITVAFSTFAYIWLYLILSVFSPNIIEVWEGILTLLFFPLTVGCAFVTSKHLPTFGKYFFSRSNASKFFHRSPLLMSPSQKNNKLKTLRSCEQIDVENPLISDAAYYNTKQADSKTFHDIFHKIRVKHPDLTLAQIEQILKKQLFKETPKSRAYYRIQATHMLTGSGNLLKNKLKKKYSTASENLPLPLMPAKPKEVHVGFEIENVICLENVGKVKLKVCADRGSLEISTEVSVCYKTIADSAQEYEDFVPTKGTLIFQPDEIEKFIEVEIVDNDIFEDDEKFFVELYDVKAYVSGNKLQKLQSKINYKTCTVIIVDDDHGGAFGFISEAFNVIESAGFIELEVQRYRGAKYAVTVPYKTIEHSAKEGTDFIGHNSELRFEDGETKKKITIKIINNDKYEKEEDFYVELSEPVWHNKQNNLSLNDVNGHPILNAHYRCRVTITEDQEFKNFVDKMITETSTTFMIGSSSWKNQFRDALTPEDINGDGVLSIKEKSLHYLSLPWKLIFSLIPPTDYYQGWLCFVVAIIVIGILTALIGDVATLFGCTIGIKDSVIAITLVALGTSMPDTFASRIAAIQDKTADSSIGNVTGSNAVNVFLGVGIAWAIAAIYHSYHNREFRVEADSLASSVFLFLIGSFICLIVLQYRRFNSKIGGELGGPLK